MNNNIKQNSITIVTAFFDVGRGEVSSTNAMFRSVDTYFQYFSNLSRLENEMIIFTSELYREKILEIRKGKPTKVITLDIFSEFSQTLTRITKIQSDPTYIEKVRPELRGNIEYWSAKYVLVTHLKPYFVNFAIDNGYVSNDMVSWVDFGYIRDNSKLCNINNWYFPFSKNHIHFFSIKRKRKFKLTNESDIYNAMFNNLVWIIGGFIVGDKLSWNRFKNDFYAIQLELMNKNIIDDEQGLLLMCKFRDKDFYKVNYLGKNCWFDGFIKFNDKTISLISKFKRMIMK